jgi:hypothetical protein
MTRVILFTACIFILSSFPAVAAHLHPEKEYQESWCLKNGGETEYVLDDRTRVDCLTGVHAIEFDFAPKWAESVGQALYYGLKTGHIPGIVLIMESDGDERFLKRVKAVAEKYSIRVWTMTPAELVQQ